MAAEASVKAGTRKHLDAALRSRAAFWALFAGVGGSVVLAAAWHDARVVAIGPLATIVVVAVVAYRHARSSAELEFFVALAPSLGMTYVGADQPWGVTPLLAAGDRRRVEHAMKGGGAELGLYTYEVRHRDTRNGTERWDPYHFTVCMLDVAPSMPSYPGVYLRRKLGLFHGDDWLRHEHCERVELESIAFNERYDLLRASDQDELALRELFSPALVDWLATHPLAPGFELRAGVLVVWLPEHVEEAGRLQFFMDAARHLAGAVSRQTDQAATTRV